MCLGGSLVRRSGMDASGGAGRRQATALLVDDHQTTRTQHMQMLQAQGYQVVMATDPAAGLALAQQAPPPRIIFVSIGLPGSGSTPFLQALRSHDTTRHIPVAVLVYHGDQALERLGLRRLGRESW
jgi:CheY-like chemotaxis protein